MWRTHKVPKRLTNVSEVKPPTLVVEDAGASAPSSSSAGSNAPLANDNDNRPPAGSRRQTDGPIIADDNVVEAKGNRDEHQRPAKAGPSSSGAGAVREPRGQRGGNENRQPPVIAPPVFISELPHWRGRRPRGSLSALEERKLRAARVRAPLSSRAPAPAPAPAASANTNTNTSHIIDESGDQQGHGGASDSVARVSGAPGDVADRRESW